ncbi:MAG: hypothetical protein QM703_13675 [Gemmatales bacterium]
MVSLVLVSLTLCVADDIDVINAKHFEIPFTIEEKNRADLAKIILFVSTEKGRTWKLHSTYLPNAENAPFIVASDGEYWFTVQLVSNSDVLSVETKTWNLC